MSKKKKGNLMKIKPKQLGNILTLEQWDKVLAGASGEMHGLVLIALKTGRRIGDILNLKQRDADLVKDKIRFTIAKTGCVLEMPLDPPSRTWIEEQVKGSNADSNALLFQELAGKGSMAVSRLLRQLGQKVGVNLDLHSFRRSFIQTQKEHGVSMGEMVNLMGYKS